VMPASLFVSGFFFPVGVLLYWMTNNLWTLGQQFFILRKMPPPGSPAAQAKAAAEKPAVDPKTLAPKPGQKPVRPKAGRPATLAPEGTVSADGTALTADGGTASPASGNGSPPQKATAKDTTAGGGGTPRTPTGKGGGSTAARGKRKRR
jgi:YidC/Oxa1 family membrane protein insertase